MTLLMLPSIHAADGRSLALAGGAGPVIPSMRIPTGSADLRGSSQDGGVDFGQSSASSSAFVVAIPNGYANISVDDLRLQSIGGEVRWTRTWDGQEWKFNSHWESLSQSWKNLTGSQTADTTAGSALAPLSSGGGGGSGCWVWVDEDWQPSVGTASIGGIPQAGPMLPMRITPFNRLMGEESTDYSPPQLVSVDYASLCAGSGISGGSSLRDAEGIRRLNELYLGEGGRYTFSNRTVLEKRAVRQLPVSAAATLYVSLAAGQITLSPELNPKGYRWMDKSGDWIDYNTQGQVVVYGDRNDNAVWLVRDTGGIVRGVVDAKGRVLFTLHYTGQLITEVKDYPTAGLSQDLISRSIKYQYDSNNRLTQVTDARGNVTKYDYDATNHIVKNTDPEGRVEQLIYTGDTVKQRIGPDGAVTDYEFEFDDTNKQFISKITGPTTTAGRRLDDFTHNRVGKLVRHIVNGRIDEELRYDTGARVEISTNARGLKTRVTRDEFEQIAEVVYPDGAVVKRSYSALNLELTEEIDEASVKTQYQYDSKNNLLKKVEAAGLPDERSTDYTRNNLGQLIRITRKGRTESNGTLTPDATWQVEYDTIGQIKNTTDPESYVRKYVYDRAGNLVSYTDPRGNTARYEVDAYGNLTKVTDALGHVRRYVYDNVGNLVTQIDARGKATQVAYDAMNRRLQTTSPIGGVFRTQYNGQGLPVLEADEDGRTNRIEYDNFLRVTRQIDALGNTTQFGYQIPDGSAAGQLGSLTEPTETIFPTFTQQTRFDERERPTSQTLKNINSQGQEILGSATIYDKRGRVKSETDGNGNTRTHSYDALGQQIETVDALGGKTASRYDARGNLLQLTDAKGNVYKFEYDRNNRLVKQTLPTGQTTRFSYDPAGNLAEKIDLRGHKLVYTFDAANRLIELKQYKEGTLLRTTTQTWDANNNLTAWSDTDATRLAAQQQSSSSATFDDANRKIVEVVNYPNPQGGSTTLSYSQAHSPAGKKLRLTWADGTNIDYAWSAHGELESVAIPGEGTISVNQFKWTASEKITLPGGGTQNKTYDGLLNLEGLKVKTPGQQSVLDLNHQYGKVQELKSRNRTDTAGGVSSTRSHSYLYDAERRLTQATTDTGLSGTDTETFTLDLVSNRIAHSRQSGTWTYDADNRLTKRGSGVCGTAGVVCYDYDAAGNLIKKTEGTQITYYAYDATNRLVEVRTGGNQLIARYGYDPLDRRLWKEQYLDKERVLLPQAKRTYYLYADEGLIAEATQGIAVSADGSVSSGESPQITTQYGPKPESEFGTGVLFIKTRGSSGQDMFAYYHHDHLETPVQATDKQGSVVWSAVYDPFGKASITTPVQTADKPTIGSHLRLPGQYEDQETGLHYNFRRYYDPEIGRYLSEDPIGMDGGINLHLYANGDPINISDSTGELPIILIPVAFCARFPRICAAIFLCVRNPDKCRKGFCKVIHGAYKGACNVPGCQPSDGSGTTQFKAAMAEACVLGRQVARTICRGTDKTPAGENHEEEIRKAQAKFNKCMEQMKVCSLR